MVGKLIVPWSSRIARPDGVCSNCGSGFLESGVVVCGVVMSFDMCTGVTEGHDCVDIVLIGRVQVSIWIPSFRFLE